MDTGGEEKKRHKFLAPLYVVKNERLYAVWIVFVLFFGLINIWGGLLLGEIASVKEALDGGVIYTFSISICAPFLAEVLVRQVVLRKMKKGQAFVFYQMITCIINILWIVILTFLWLGEHKGGVLLQVILGIISVFFAFYMYCVSQMDQYGPILSEYDDDPYDYLEKEKGRMKETEEKSRQLASITSNKGDIEI
ncbi:hypothetical protein AALA54_12120 [Oscillospiraceae bacterium 44-34]